jgi:hypothetical protein
MNHLTASTVHEDHRTRQADRRRACSGGAAGEARPRPDVSGYFAVTLICALASGFFVSADLLREQIGFDQILAFAAIHPMSYLLAGCVVLLRVLLAFGDV